MKKLVKYGVAAKDYKTPESAAGDTYTLRDGSLVPTPLIFPDNPYNELVRDAKFICDLGCGIGRNLPWIMENTQAMYYGIDPNDSMIEHFWKIQDEKWKNRVKLVKTFDDLDDNIQFDVIVCTFVFQHIGYRPPEDHMNVTDITQQIRNFTHDDTVWIFYEHDWEEPGWIDRWFIETDIWPAVYYKNYTGIPELTDRGAHHLIIYKGK